jgi:DNA-binding NtrC family response regulator
VNGNAASVDNNPLVGVVDNQLSIRESLSRLFCSAGLNVETFASSDEFLTNARFGDFSCLVLEARLPGISGLQLQQKLLSNDVNIPIIFVTSHGDIASAVQAMKSGAVEFLTKPFEDQYLLETVRSVIARYAVKQQTRHQNSQEHFGKFSRPEGASPVLRSETEIIRSSQGSAVARDSTAFGQIIGQGYAWRQIVNQIEIVAPTDATVLVLGETGTGKELIACELHRRGRRRDKPLIRVNCACIPKDLFESEFFGHARGAFTGAVKDRVGRFEAADGGTLFLDEVGEIPLELQCKLLRVLQEKSYERTGDTKTRTADVRIVAATNRNIREEVVAGRFREDLYYRLNVVPIKLAPLRDRKEDISLLASHLIETTVKEIRCPRPRLTRAGIDQLQNYDWPGNIRELCNAIQQAAILAQGGDLDFNLPVDGRKAKTDWQTTGVHHEVGAGYLTETEMRQWKRQNILIVLQKTGWKIKGRDGAAELLGIRPTTLISQIGRLGLRRRA